MKINVSVRREGRWWMIRVNNGPKFSNLTQARRLADVEPMARDLAYLNANVTPSTVEVNVLDVTVDRDDVNLYTLGRMITERRAQARAEMARAAHELQKFVIGCSQLDVPVRDIAWLADISPQRVSQIVRNSPEDKIVPVCFPADP